MIYIYGNSKTCSPCGQLKQYLDAVGEEYTFYDLASTNVEEVRKYKKEIFALFNKGEQVLIPVILISDFPKIVGYGAEQIDKINEYLSKR